LDEVAPFELAVLLVRQGEPADGAGDAGEAVGGAVFLFVVGTLVDGGGGALTVVDECGFAPVGEVDQHEAAATDVAGFGEGHGEGECRGDGGVCRVPTPRERVAPDRRGVLGDGDDDSFV
jgi:hypothetical protein